ncbi:MAG: hypothetical protein ABW352_15915 [Polyangiales bacterium]
MRHGWLAIALWFLASRVQAQPEPLAEPGPVLEQPYLECIGCQVQPAYYDPYATQLTQLRRQRPSRFGPIALIAGGAFAAMLGTGVLADDPPPSDRLSAAALVVAGATATGFGAIWLVKRKRERAAYDERIVRLEQARLAGIPFGSGPEPVARPLARPGLAGPITVTAIGAGVLAMGVLMTTLAITGHFADNDDLLAPGILFDAAGLGMVVVGGIWWAQRRAERRADDRLDLSSLPLRVRW